MIEFYDRSGQAAAFCERSTELYLWDGRAAAFIHDDAVFAYSGRFIGWIENGWMADREGHRLLFEFDAVGGPAKPPRGPRSAPGHRGAKPPRGPREDAPPRKPFSAYWSETPLATLI